MRRFTPVEFVKLVQDLVGGEYDILSDYKTMSTPVRVRHNVCGFVWEVYPCNFVYKQSRCPKCANRLQKTHEEFMEIISALTGVEYEVLETFKGRNIAPLFLF